MFNRLISTLEGIAKGIAEGNQLTRRQMQQASEAAEQEIKRRDQQEREAREALMEKDTFLRYVARGIIVELIQRGYDRIDPVHAQGYKPGEQADGRVFDIDSDEALRDLAINLGYHNNDNPTGLRIDYVKNVIRNHYWRPILKKRVKEFEAVEERKIKSK